MLALLFEMEPRQGHEDHYFEHAARLRPLVMKHEGLLFLERFKSLSRPNIILSHSIWRDEASIATWRADCEHQRSQVAGRFEHFRDYRIRIAPVLTFFDAKSAQKPPKVKKDAYGLQSAGAQDRFVVISRRKAGADKGAIETFSSVMHAGAFLCVESVENEQAGRDTVRDLKEKPDVTSALLARVCRDYGMFDRTEAPQYFDPVNR